MYYYSTSAATRSRTSAYCQRNISEAPDADLTFLTAINSGRQSGGPKDPRPEVSNSGFIFHVPPGYSRPLPHQDPKASGPSSDHAKRHPRRLGPRRHVGTAPDSEQSRAVFLFPCCIRVFLKLSCKFCAFSFSTGFERETCITVSPTFECHHKLPVRHKRRGCICEFQSILHK